MPIVLGLLPPPPDTLDARLELTATPPATRTCRRSLDLDFSETKVY